MFKKCIYGILIIVINNLIVGCGAKQPVSLEDVADLGINNQILENRYDFVPKDKFLTNSNWVYSIEAKPEGEYLFSNDQMVKVFLLAHNAKRIVIFGDKNRIKQYEQYFKDNGVKANIRTQPIDLNDEYKDYIKIIFFNSTIDDGSEPCKSE